jgi:cob(I)alamin adenosyltransferase
MTRIYTRSGDDGGTGLFGGQRVSKDALRVEAYGTVDELNAVLGLVRTQEADTDIDALLQTVQNDLFGLGADLATPEAKDTIKGRVHITRVALSQVTYLETQIDRYEDELPPLTNFILPGGSPLAAGLHHARVVCRRTERRAVTLAHAEAQAAPVNPIVIQYLNRLSDLLFVLARIANHRRSLPDVVWNPELES